MRDLGSPGQVYGAPCASWGLAPLKPGGSRRAAGAGPSLSPLLPVSSFFGVWSRHPCRRHSTRSPVPPQPSTFPWDRLCSVCRRSSGFLFRVQKNSQPMRRCPEMTQVSARQRPSGRSCHQGPGERDSRRQEGVPSRLLRLSDALRCSARPWPRVELCTGDLYVPLTSRLGDGAVPVRV